MLANPGPLSLRIRGGEHDGRLINIQSAKCTVGSAEGCTLRLRAAGVAPLHCWILRGRRGAVIRRLHNPAALNGSAFEESFLSAGDRLRLGVVDLEVLQCGDMPASDATSLAVRQLENIETPDERLERALAEIARLEDESRQGWQSSIVAAERADQLRDAVTNTQEELAESGSDLASCRETITRQTTDIHQLSRELSEARAKLDLASRSAAMTVRLGERNEEAKSAERELAARCAELEIQLSASQAKLAAAEATLADVKQAHQEASCRADQATEKLHALEQELATERVALTNLRAQAAEHEALEARADALAQQLEAQSEALRAAQDAAATAAQASLAGPTAEEQAAAEQQQALFAAREAELARQEQTLQESLAGLANEREQSALEQAQLATTRQELAQMQQNLQAAREQLSLDREAFEAERQSQQQLLPPGDPIEQSGDQRACEPSGEVVDHGQTVVFSGSADVEPGNEPAKVEDPTRSSSVSSVLSRLVQAGVWRKPEDSDPAPDEAASGESANHVSDSPVQPELPEPTVAAAEPSAPSKPAQDDDSIEDYMDRLLKRVRGESTTSTGTWKQSYTEAAPAAEPVNAAPPEPESEPVVTLPQEEYVPRSKAPELTSDLFAMRELANSAARSAIDQHVRRLSGQQAAGRMVGACLTVGTSLLLAYWAWRTRSLGAGVGAAIGGAVGAYWSLAAVRRMLTVIRLNRPEPKFVAGIAPDAELKPAGEPNVVKVP